MLFSAHHKRLPFLNPKGLVPALPTRGKQPYSETSWPWTQGLTAMKLPTDCSSQNRNLSDRHVLTRIHIQDSIHRTDSERQLPRTECTRPCRIRILPPHKMTLQLRDTVTPLYPASPLTSMQTLRQRTILGQVGNTCSLLQIL